MKGILFKNEMVRAIAEGRKTVTRRLIPQLLNPDFVEVTGTDSKGTYGFHYRFTDLQLNLKCKYLPGETVYIKETWACGKFYDPYNFSDSVMRDVSIPRVYLNDTPKPDWCGRTRSARFMPELFARYFIKIKDVRPERLQAITEEDAILEGVSPLLQGNGWQVSSAHSEYIHLWNSINPKQKFEASPWVWRIEFEVVPQ